MDWSSDLLVLGQNAIPPGATNRCLDVQSEVIPMITQSLAAGDEDPVSIVEDTTG